MIELPVIRTLLDLDTGCYSLTATSYGHCAPAGPRLFRGQPTPDIAWSYTTQEAAEADAAKLTEYIALAWRGWKKADKTKVEARA